MSLWGCSILDEIPELSSPIFVEIKPTLKEQGGDLISRNSDSSGTHLPIFVEDQVCINDSTISLSELLESLSLECREVRKYSGTKYYCIDGKITCAQTTFTLEKIIQEYSGQHDLIYAEIFLRCKIPESFCCVNSSSATFPLNPSLDSMNGWKGISICAAFDLCRLPSLILDNLDLGIECCLISSTGWSWGISFELTESEILGSKGRGLVWISYFSRESFSDKMLNGCTSLKVIFTSNKKDLTICCCGHQLVFHQNVEELVETIMQYSREHLGDHEGSNDDYNDRRRHL